MKIGIWLSTNFLRLSKKRGLLAWTIAKISCFLFPFYNVTNTVTTIAWTTQITLKSHFSWHNKTFGVLRGFQIALYENSFANSAVNRSMFSRSFANLVRQLGSLIAWIFCTKWQACRTNFRSLIFVGTKMRNHFGWNLGHVDILNALRTWYE